MNIRLPSIGGRERAIIRELGEDFSIIHESVLDFGKLLAALASNDSDAVRASYHRVLEDEKRADDFHRRLSGEIAEGAFFGGIREDILNLLEKMDNIADSAKGAARLIEVEGPLDEFAISLLGSTQMKGFVEDLVGTVEALGRVLEAFGLGRKEILSRIPKVEELEEAADARRVEVARQLFSTEKRPDPVTIIQMKEFLRVADSIADNAEDASDVILILVAKGYD